MCYCINIVLFVHISIFREKRKYGIIYRVLSIFEKIFLTKIAFLREFVCAFARNRIRNCIILP